MTACTIAFVITALGSVSAQKVKQNISFAAKSDVKFLNDIEVDFEGVNTEPAESTKIEKPSNFDNHTSGFSTISARTIISNAVESITSLQLKYGILLNTEVELVKNFSLYQAIDDWYGTPYRYGGTTKSGIDCSAFVRAIYMTIFGILLPRTAKEQYNVSRQIDRTELKEGDLVFFNTLGGVSHVGIYLQNNKFVHAATSAGVMISDLDDNYWAKRFIGGSRYDMAAASGLVFSQP